MIEAVISIDRIQLPMATFELFLKNYTLYIALPYTGMEEWSFRFSCETAYILQRKGYSVFSPIMHTHHFHKFMQSKLGISAEKLNAEMNYVLWDLSLLKSNYAPCILMSKQAFKTEIEYIGNEPWDCVKNQTLEFRSMGCLKEFMFAQANDIPVIVLEDFVEKGKIVRLN